MLACRLLGIRLGRAVVDPTGSGLVQVLPAVASRGASRHRYRSRNRCCLSARAVLAIPRREVGCMWGPVRQCPADVSWAGCVLPSRPSPRRGLSPPLSTLRDTTPHEMPVGSLPCLVPRLPRRAQEPLGLPTCFDASLPACHGLRTPADLPRLAIPVVRVLPSGAFKPSASATSLFDAVPALQGAQSPLRPTGCAVYASPILFAACTTTTPPWTQDSLRVGGYALPRQELAPCKRRQAFLGARTPRRRLQALDND